MRLIVWPRQPLIWLLLCCPFLVTLGCSCSDPVSRRNKRAYSRDEDEAPTTAAAAKPAPAAGTPANPAANPGANPAAASPQPAAGVTGAPAGAPPTAITLSAEMPATGAGSVYVEPINPRKPLDLVERRQQSLLRLKKIGLAIGDYAKERKTFPPAAIYNRDKYPLLSWRVHLLPYLGEEDLYSLFNLNEPWNGPTNGELIKRIPAVFQSPEHLDGRTNYLLIVGPGTLFSGTEGTPPGTVADGLANTLMLAEVNDSSAIPWTQPVDLNFSPDRDRDPRLSIDQLRDDGTFVVWGNAEVGRIPPNVDDEFLRPMFTKAGKELFARDKVNALAAAEVDPEFAGRLKPVAVAVGAKPPVDKSGDLLVGAGKARPGEVEPPKVETPGAPAKVRLPVPDDDAQKKAQELFRDIFRTQFAAAKTVPQKYELAKRLFEQAGKIKADATGRYVLLVAVSKVAAEMGDVTTALAATEQLIADYDVKPFETRSELILRAGTQKPYSKACNDKLILASEELLDQALVEDDFELANKLLTLGLAAARRGNERVKGEELASRRRDIEIAKAAYAKVKKAVDALEDNPNDATANSTIGRYFCFIKHNWERGLPMLALGDDDALQRLARQELRQDANPEAQIELADAWWEHAKKEKDPPAAREIFVRSIHWYLSAMQTLPEGLLKVKAEERVKEAERKWGKNVVEALRLALKAPVRVESGLE